MKKILVIILLILYISYIRITVYASDDVDYESLINDHQSIMIIVHPTTGEIYYANQAAVDFYGYPLDALVNMNINQINTLTPEDIALETSKALDEERNFFEFKHKLANNEIRTVHVYSYPVDIEGETYLYSIIVDQTEYVSAQTRNEIINFVVISLLVIAVIFVSYLAYKNNKKKHEITKINQTLIESEQRFKVLHDVAFSGLIIQNRGIILDCNQKLADITGYSITELRGTNSLNLIDPKYHEDFLNKVNHYSEQPFETMGLRKNNHSYALEIKARKIPYEGKTVIVFEFRDISDIKQQQEELMKKDSEKCRILSNLPCVSYQSEFNQTWEVTFLSDKCEELTGYKPIELINNEKRAYNDIIAPKYRDYVIEQRHLAHLNKNIYNVEYEIMRQDGSMIWVLEKGNIFLQDDTWFIEGFIMDITERKLNEQQIDFAIKHDTLTGLPNRVFFDQVINKIDQQKNYPLIISVIDIDGLKLINDTYGHKVGDEAVMQFSKVLSASCKNNAFIARIGGDEFVLIFTKTDLAKFEKIRTQVFDPLLTISIREIPLSSSYGIATKTDQSKSIQDILIEAENDMYAKKTLHNQSSRNQAIAALFDSLKEKYQEEREHSERVSQYCLLMGEKLNLSSQEKLELEFAGRMHDIGKITILDSILKKPGDLTDQEREIMKNHTINGYQILKSADKYSRLADYALTHHERWDGKGYPKGLSADNIPLFSRIIAIVDAFEAMTSDRPYRKAMSLKAAVEELNRCAGLQFDPQLVRVFVDRVLPEEYSDEDFSVKD